jgi:hypothetical protein
MTSAVIVASTARSVDVTNTLNARMYCSSHSGEEQQHQ